MASAASAADSGGGGGGPGLATPRLLLPALAVAGALFCAWLGWRTYRAEVEVARLRTERAASQHLGLIRDHLTARETLARAVAATFRAPERVAAGGLASVDPRFLALVPDITSFVWVPRVEPSALPDALAALAASGVERPAILGPARAVIAAPEGRAVHPVLDILPKTEVNRLSLGLDLASLPLPRAALLESERRRDAAATAPLELVQLPGERALVLYVPVFARGEEGGVPLGHLGFSYRFSRLVGGAANGGPPEGLGVAIADAAAPEAGLVYRAGPARPERVAPILREASFGGRPWRVEYWPATDPRDAALRNGVATAAAAGLALLASLLVAWRLSFVGRRLSRALAERERAEARLRTVIGELNHRTTNILAIAQSIATQTVRESGGGEAEAVADRIGERLRAMTRATSLLRDAEWQGVRLGQILDGSGLPHADRVRREGPDVALAPGPAQSVVLLVHELWTNAAKHGALSVPEGRASLAVNVEGGRFRLGWSEEGGPPARLGDRSGFGRLLIEQLVPRQLGGEGRLEGGSSGLCYLLDAPAEEVLAEPA